MELYWINKNSDSAELTQSSGIERRRIQKHVQRGLKRGQKVTARKIASSFSADNKVLRIDKRLTGSCDPFCSASVSLNANLCDLLESHVKIYLQPSIWIHEPDSIQGKGFKDDKSMIKILQNAVEDSLVMYSILSAAASRVRNAEAAPRISVSEADELLFSHNAIRLLRERLASTAKRTKADIERLVACIAFLLASEVYREEDDYLTGRQHSRAVVQLLIPIGGIMGMDNVSLRHQLLMSDLFLAMINMEPCLHGCGYDPGPLQRWAIQTVHTDNSQPLGAVILRLENDIVPRHIWSLISNAIECYSAFVYMNKTPMLTSRRLSLSHWITKRNMALLNRLLALVIDDERVNAVRITVVLWMVLWTNSILRAKAPKRIVAMLDEVLIKIEAERWLEHIDIQFWILCMGYSCAEENSAIAHRFEEQICGKYWDQSEVFWPSGQRRNLSEALEDFLRGYLYHGPVQQLQIRSLAQSISQCQEETFE